MKIITDYLSQALERHPMYRAIRCKQSQSLVQLGNYEKALAVSNQAIALNLNQAEAWYSRGDALANLKRYPEALASFDRAISLNPTYAEAWSFRGVILLHLQQYEEALISCEKVLEIEPNNQEILIWRGAALQHLGFYKAAYASYKQALGSQRARKWFRLPNRLQKLFNLFKFNHEGLI